MLHSETHISALYQTEWPTMLKVDVHIAAAELPRCCGEHQIRSASAALFTRANSTEIMKSWIYKSYKYANADIGGVLMQS